MEKEELAGAVPDVTGVPADFEKEEARGVEDARAEWEERAAILEFDGGHSRAEAERRAMAEVYPGEEL
jgi:hypothetical protein